MFWILFATLSDKIKVKKFSVGEEDFARQKVMSNENFVRQNI